jgi:hypothetical protein
MSKEEVVGDVRKRAVIVGINYAEQDSHHSGHNINEAWKFHEALIHEYGFDDEEIYMLTDQHDQYEDNLPTKENISSGLCDFSANSKHLHFWWMKPELVTPLSSFLQDMAKRYFCSKHQKVSEWRGPKRLHPFSIRL